MTQLKKVVGITPFEEPDTHLAHALVKAGAIGVLDLGRDHARGIAALEEMMRISKSDFGVRIAEHSQFKPEEIPDAVRWLVLGSPCDLSPWKKPGREIWVQVTSITEAIRAFEGEADGLTLKGSESGGRVGQDASFILVQQVRSLNIPYWVQGGMGQHSAAACFVAGASGVVFDSQLALFKECRISDDIKKAISFSDGTEAKTIYGHQVFTRPDLKIPTENTISSADFVGKLGARSLQESFIPAGQDLCLARTFSEKHLNLRAFVLSIVRSAEGHLRQAKALRTLEPGSSLAQSNGTRFALAQGPMTRVSDKAEFIDAVANNGALPFLALSLLRKDQAHELLKETAALLGSKPWGVGILGFVPEALQREQLEVLEQYQPSALLIAGGRPSQAAPFEARGIRTFLHVPSPGLLRQFLKEGARRFVFEGRECGGHVGPRSSFVLWESQIEILLSFEALHEVEIFFAGGIHDAMSGAMVATLSAPLAARGAKVGALIGTAYLFTKEAVATGAILPRFQQAAVDCKSTALLESGPGHATRCAFSPVVEKFEQRKNELKASLSDPKEIGAELESFNVGRLRIASKGVERVGDEIRAVDEHRQQEEGLFMLGQVAQLRDKVSTMLDVHEEITWGAARFLERVPVADSKATAPADVAIVGMAGVFPGAKNIHEFWKNIVGTQSSITEVPASRWNKELYFEKNSKDPHKSISKWGGFIDDVPFDPVEFGIPPNSMGAIEPIQLLSLKVAKQALADAGYADRSFDREKTSVIFGAESGTDLAGAYGFRALYPQFLGALPPELDEFLPSLSEDSFPGVLANVIAGRIANRLDLGGSNYTVDAACASSLAALDLAVKELSHGESDMVLCGGADVHNSINDYLMFSSVHALSPTGSSKPFSAEADGIVISEGVAVIVLKRLEDALRDGDRIYSVVRSVASSSDGKSLGLTAPRKEGQMRALGRAYARAGVSPSQIELVEAHGTGTVVGDRTELQTLTEVFSEAGSLNRSCALGSVKSQIGHTKCAAGLAGVIKTSLGIFHGVIPPTINAEKPNPGHQAEASPFYFASKAIPWSTPLRLASVSAFGFGGTNFHAVLSSHESKVAAPQVWPVELFLFSGNDELSQVQTLLERGIDLDLARLACTLSVGNDPDLPKIGRVTILATSLKDLREKVERALRGEAAPGIYYLKPRAGKLAFLFSGQGSQKSNMGTELFQNFPHLRKYLKLGKKWERSVYPHGANDPFESTLRSTEITQPALGMIELAQLQLLQDLEIDAAQMAGHSYGELVALCAARSLHEADLLEISEARGCAIRAAAQNSQGAMAAILADPATIESALVGIDVVIANHNSPKQSVISGHENEVARAIQEFQKRGIGAKRLPVSCAFHSPLVKEAELSFEKVLEDFEVSRPLRAVYSNSTAQTYDPSQVRRTLAHQIGERVRFSEMIEQMYQDGARIFVEVGPGSVLKGLVGQILGSRDHFVESLDRSIGGMAGLLSTIAELISFGIDVNASMLFESRKIKAYDLKQLASQKIPPTLWYVNGHLAKPANGDIPKGALRPNEVAIACACKASVSLELDAHSRENTVRDYLQAMRHLVEGQKQVMLEYLGSATAPQVLAVSSHANLRPRASESAPKPISTPSKTQETPAPTRIDAGSLVLKIVSDKTGYPAEMLGLDQDLEADLSIDSIKRFEIIAEIGDKLKLSTSQPGGGLDKFASIKTLRALTAAVTAGLGESPVVVAPKAENQPVARPVGPEVSVDEIVLGVVSQKTGYPIEMLGLDQDLEADLSVDSIKRFEILSEVGERLKLNSGDDKRGSLDKLASLKTLKSLIMALKERVPRAHDESGVAAVGTRAELSDSTVNGLIPVNQYYFRIDEAPAPLKDCFSFENRSFGIVEDGRGISDCLATLLKSHGARVRKLRAGEAWKQSQKPLDGIIMLSLVDQKEVKPVDVFKLTQEATRQGINWIVGITGRNGNFGYTGSSTITDQGIGMSGLFKSLAKEFQEKLIKVIDLDLEASPQTLAEQIYTEMQSKDELVEVGYQNGVRKHLVAVPFLPEIGTERIGLNSDSVIVMLGGARGIAAKIALKLAGEYQCRFEIVGRSMKPLEENPETAKLATLSELRNHFLKSGQFTKPSEIEAECKEILNDRDIRRTFAKLNELGSTFDYHCFDVRDRDQLRAFIDRLYARGPIDGVIHAAGVLSDSLLMDKTEESFARVFDTKMNPAEVLVEKLRNDVKFVAFFSSVSGCFGNRGQTDYGAANNALDHVARVLSDRIEGRAVSFNWGPWAETGMVSPSVESEYRKKGIGLIPPNVGTQKFLDELKFGDRANRQVVIMSGSPENLKALS